MHAQQRSWRLAARTPCACTLNRSSFLLATFQERKLSFDLLVALKLSTAVNTIVPHSDSKPDVHHCCHIAMAAPG